MTFFVVSFTCHTPLCVQTYGLPFKNSMPKTPIGTCPDEFFIDLEKDVYKRQAYSIKRAGKSVNFKS